MSGNICQYRGCGDSVYKNKSIKVFKFPAKSNPSRARDWIINSGNVALSQLTMDELKNRVICSKHFEDRMFKNKLRASLNNNAVPIPYKETTQDKLSPNKVHNLKNVVPAAKRKVCLESLDKNLSEAPPSNYRSFSFAHPSISQDNNNFPSIQLTVKLQTSSSSNSESSLNSDSSAYENSSESTSSGYRSFSFPHSSILQDNNSPSTNFTAKVQTPKKTYSQSSLNSDSSLPLNLNSLSSPAVRFLTPTHSSTPRIDSTTPVTSLNTPTSTKFVRSLINMPDIIKPCKRKLELDDAIDDTPRTKKIKFLHRTIIRLRKDVHRKNVMLYRYKKQREKMIAEKKENYKLEQDLNFLSGASKILVQMQLKSKSRKKFRWSKEEKKFSMSLYYKSPATYKYLRRNGIILPGVSTVKKWFQSIHFLPGLNNAFLEHLKIKCSTMEEMEKACVISFDEMSIKKCIELNKSLDFIEGFQDLGDFVERKNLLGTHALVIMIRGLYSNWKLPLAYFITSNGMQAEDMKTIFEGTFSKLVSTGFDPKVLVCDQGPQNRKFYSLLGVTTNNYRIKFGGKSIFCMYDVPHLMKSLRNNLLTGNYFYDNIFISFMDVRKTYEIDVRSKTTRAMPKITSCHMNPNAFKKMSCKIALQVFSRTVYAAIKTAFETGELQSNTALDTADFILFLNNLFDTLNSSNLYDPNPYKKPLSSDNVWQFELLSKAEQIFEKLHKISLTKKKKIKISRPACFDGMLMTIRAVQGLFAQESNIWGRKFSDVSKNVTKTLKFATGKFSNVSENVPKTQEPKKRNFFLMTSRLNQDPLENFFSIVRQKNGYNRNPTARLFRCSYAHITTISFFKYSDLGNCQADDDVFLNLENKAHQKADKENVSEVERTSTDTNNVNINVSNTKTDSDNNQSNDIIDDEYDDDEDDEDVNDDQDDQDIGDIGQNNIKDDTVKLEKLDFTENSVATLETCSNVYVAGYLAHVGLGKCDCPECKSILLNGVSDKKEKSNELLSDKQQTLLVFRTFENITNPEKGLKVPSLILVNIVKFVLELCTLEFQKAPQRKNLVSSIFELAVKKIQEKFPTFYMSLQSQKLLKCRENRNDLIKLLVRTKIFRDCKRLSSKMYSTTGKLQPKLRILNESKGGNVKEA